MPILNSVGALKEQNNVFTVTPIADNQWIAQIDNSITTPGAALPSSKGNLFLVTPGYYGLLKIDTNGNLVSVFNSNPASFLAAVICVDKNENVYVGDTADIGGLLYPIIIKYNSNGSIVWQKYIDEVDTTVLSIQVTATNELFILTGSNGGGDPASGFGPYILFKIDTSDGSIINQRELLKYTSSGISDLSVDNINNQLLVSGTDYQTTSEILIGTYDYTNTDTASNIVYQSSSTDNYDTFFAGFGNQSMVVDNTYIYQVAYRIISGITRSVYMQIDRSTGSVSYSNRITVGGGALTLYGITKDNSGYLYVTGRTATVAGATFIMQIEASTGNITWIKQLGDTIQTDNINSVTWSKGFLYFSATTQAGVTQYYAAIKLKDDGSVADGTYGTYWTFSTPTPTTISVMPDSTGTTTGSNNTTSNTVTDTSVTKVSSSITITTYSL